jgi:thioredoxin-like negative regulator of GroEL
MISPALLDPWDDASLLAQRLQQSNTRLLILLGAEQWCAKCRELRPQFDDLVAQAKPEEVWLWLDLEDHADFIGDYLPDSLPMLIAYQGDVLLHCQVVADAQQALAAQIQHIRALLPRTTTPVTPDPGIRARLMMQDWANE